jgi:hypothetical protein
MKVRITDANHQVQSWHLNIEDALELIEGLTRGIKMSMENGIPYNSAT